MQIRVIYALGSVLLATIVWVGSLSLEVAKSLGQEEVSAQNASAQNATTTANTAAPDDELFPGGYMGNTDCLSCHKGQIRKQGFVRLIEPEIWTTDPHSKAFQFINWSESADTASRKLSQKICDKLMIKDIHQAQQCLSCHANWVAGLTKPPPFYEDGVGCESCHGPSLKWELLHRQPNWRALPVADKTAKQMIDVRNPIRRAEQCFSCHIGNVDEGKLITHEMYAAGHPPLPGIEIESFAQQMPRHWRYLEEKVADSGTAGDDENPQTSPFEFFHEFVQQNHAYLKSDDPDETLKTVKRHNHGAAAVVLGGVVALREAIDLTRDLASSDEIAWPELSSFDCTACHHDLKQAEFRQIRNEPFPPGRPAMHAWPTALVRLGIFHVAADATSFDRKSSEFHQMLAAVQDQFVRTPFGDPAKLQEASAAFSQWLTDELITQVAKKPFDNEAVQLACRRLAYMACEDEADHDFDSARQIAWALRALYCDLDEKPRGDEQIQVLFRQLANDLRLDLPNSSGEYCETAATTASPDEAPRDTPAALTSSVPAALAAEVQFDHQRFKETMRQLQPLLK